MYKEGEERFKAAREEAARPDDNLACAEERLAAKRAAELEKAGQSDRAAASSHCRATRHTVE
jgi:hypothetical protein